MPHTTKERFKVMCSDNCHLKSMFPNLQNFKGNEKAKLRQSQQNNGRYNQESNAEEAIWSTTSAG